MPSTGATTSWGTPRTSIVPSRSPARTRAPAARSGRGWKKPTAGDVATARVGAAVGDGRDARGRARRARPARARPGRVHRQRARRDWPPDGRPPARGPPGARAIGPRSPSGALRGRRRACGAGPASAPSRTSSSPSPLAPSLATRAGSSSSARRSIAAWSARRSSGVRSRRVGVVVGHASDLLSRRGLVAPFAPVAGPQAAHRLAHRLQRAAQPVGQAPAARRPRGPPARRDRRTPRRRGSASSGPPRARRPAAPPAGRARSTITAAEPAGRLGRVGVGALAGLGHDAVDDAELELVGGRHPHRQRRVGRLLRRPPQDRGAALGADHGVDGVLQGDDDVADGDGEGPARAALAGDDGDDRAPGCGT